MNSMINNNINNFFDTIITNVRNFLPWDFHIRLIMFAAALVLVLGIQRVYENIKKEKNNNKESLN